VVSWTDSIQEYSGGLGNVYHSGERPISDCFRSLTTQDFGNGSAALSMDINPGEPVRRIPRLPPLDPRSGPGQRSQFEQDHEDLLSDWEIAVRFMEELSSAEGSGVGLKRKRKILGIRDKSIFEGKNPEGEPLDYGYQQLGERTDVEGDLVYSSGEDDPSDYGEFDSDTDDEY